MHAYISTYPHACITTYLQAYISTYLHAYMKVVLGWDSGAKLLLDSNRNLMMVVHYDFIAAFLDAILVPETTGHFARWRHHNTAITVVDIPKAQGHDATIVNVNNIAHILDTKDPSLVSGFPL